jgi:hypothetical protein
MALRDWHAWQIGILWAIGIALAWLTGRLGVAAVSSHGTAPAGPVSGGGAPMWTTAVTLLILTVLLIITVRWVKGRLLDQ